MSVQTKRRSSLALALCLCLSLLAFAPVTAHADTEIKNATTTVDYIDPVVLLEVSKNVVRATGTGYKLISASWIGSDGKAETNAFKSGSYRLLITLQADAGYVFAADAKGYVNNSNTGVTTERSEDGKTLTLSRTCNTTIWTPVPVKHPGPETVKEGDWCSFVVSGMYVGSYEWIFETPEGGTVPAERLKEKFPDVRLEGLGTGKIKVFNIPYGMNGWKVYCTEWSADKLSFVNTNSTTLTVTSDAPQPTPTPEPTPAPEAQEQTLAELIRRPQLSYEELAPFDPERPALPRAVRQQVELRLKYAGYIQRQLKQVEEFRRMEDRLLPEDLDYEQIPGLRLEAREKLSKIRPASFGQAGRISGVSPADITVLMVYTTTK